MADSMGERVFAAHLLLEGAVGHRVTLAELGAMVGAELKRKPFSPTSVLDWETDASAPDTKVLAALCRVCAKAGVEVDPGWLAFGSDSYAPPPVGLATALSRRVSLSQEKKKVKRSRKAR